jgi:hypothetical protein
MVGAARSPSPSRSQGGAAAGLDPTIEEVRGSLEYFMSHAHVTQLSEVLVTGGGALTAGIVEQLSSALGIPVKLASIGPSCTPSRLGLQDDVMAEVSLRWTTAVGLALWGTGDIAAPSLIPAEIRQRQQLHQAIVGGVAVLAVAAVGLGALSFQHVQQVSHVRAQTSAYDVQASGLQTRISSYQKVLAVKGEVDNVRALAAGDLAGDVNWVSLVKRIQAALPSGVTLTSLSLSRTNLVGTAATAAPVAPTPDNIGSVAMSLSTTGGPLSVAEFVRKMWVVPGLYALWVSTTTDQGGTAPTVFSATAQLTSAAFSSRAQDLPGLKP